MALSVKISNSYSLWPSNSTTKNWPYGYTCIVALFIKNKNWRPAKCLLTGGWLHNSLYTHSVVYYTSKKKEEWGRFVSAVMGRSPRYVFQQDVKQYVWHNYTCVNKKK